MNIIIVSNYEDKLRMGLLNSEIELNWRVFWWPLKSTSQYHCILLQRWCSIRFNFWLGPPINLKTYVASVSIKMHVIWVLVPWQLRLY